MFVNHLSLNWNSKKKKDDSMAQYKVTFEFVNNCKKVFQVEFDSTEKARDDLLSQGDWVDFQGCLVNLTNVIMIDIKELESESQKKCS
ncbi:hypothetical protein [Peribacillus glennii]|uniref:Uncharacterized protein n=1 Tax=Peribacillus glennii TaxID=2303991 RepID=A0A372L9N3_9BACI|nr:hypothetical protein [Peribacillus glennii]RFU61289.1 hypothetical protein D0466_18945 [Peribacillus glennii]